MGLIKAIFSFFSVIIFLLTPQKSYTEGLVGQPASFLPNEVVTENDKTVSKLIFRSLFVYDATGELTEDLADSYAVSDDGLSYTVYLKKGQKWSNGSEITADDLLYSAFTSSQLKEIATDKIDRYTIRFTLPNKYAPFLSLLTYGVTPAITNNDRLQPTSSGPYKVVRIKRDGPAIREVILQSIDEDYKIKKVSFRYYEELSQLVTAEKLGEIDGFASMEDVSWPNLNKNTFYQRGIYYSLILNFKNSKFKGLDVRKKLQAKTPVEEIMKGKGIATHGPLSESPYTMNNLNYSLYNSNLTDDLRLQVTLTLPDTKEHVETGEIIKEAWKKIGVDVTLRIQTPEQIENEIIPKRDYEILLYGQEVSRDPDRYVLWHSTRINPPGLNLSGFENIRLDRALEEGRNTMSFNDRKKHYNNFQEAIYENVPVIFLYHPMFNYYTSKRVKITNEPNTYYLHDRFLDFKNWDVM